MKIMHVLLSPRIGGAETFVDALSNELESLGITQIVHLLDADNVTHSKIKRILRLRAAIKKYGPDVILSHTTIPGLYARLFAPLKSTSVTVLHSSGNDYSGIVARFLGRFLGTFRTSGIIAVSEVAKLRYEEFLGNAHHIDVIINGSSPMNPKRSDSYLEVPSSIVTVARISAVKNPSLWSEVAKNVNLSNPNTLFEWYGPISEGEEFGDFLSRHAPSKGQRVFLRGATDSVNEVLGSADILFHPSDREALPISILEATMVGLPIVCSDEVAACVGLQFVDETFPAGDAKAAEGALSRVIGNYSFYADRAILRRSVAVQDFSIGNCARRYRDVLEGILAKKKS